jgi:hypothetical protein
MHDPARYERALLRALRKYFIGLSLPEWCTVEDIAVGGRYPDSVLAFGIRAPNEGMTILEGRLWDEGGAPLAVTDFRAWSDADVKDTNLRRRHLLPAPNNAGVYYFGHLLKVFLAQGDFEPRDPEGYEKRLRDSLARNIDSANVTLGGIYPETELSVVIRVAGCRYGFRFRIWNDEGKPAHEDGASAEDWAYDISIQVTEYSSLANPSAGCSDDTVTWFDWTA